MRDSFFPPIFQIPRWKEAGRREGGSPAAGAQGSGEQLPWEKLRGGSLQKAHLFLKRNVNFQSGCPGNREEQAFLCERRQTP